MFRAIKQHVTTSYMANLSMAWQTKDKEQNSLTELIPKINIKDGRIHANMANDMTDSE